ncbi:hypothetical protein [Gottfriedia solisilvae]|uniref:Uncharacterized protein n=1 Tax=Gottfriedia solisilvae TaxID=1516104 RepID=A0A8J3EUB3_9BACI|nr:hypothetical protein [Gottfriedia solisilvae]GGI11508.1 hypothetical protein GCM10007380_08190 [Gottfriedia solisilvae]
MKYEYKIVDIFNDTLNNTCYFVPYSDTDYGIVQMDVILELKSPYSEQELEEYAIKALNLCHTAEPSQDSKTPLQKLLKIKSYKKSTENMKCISFIWRKKSGYFIGVMEREKGGGYSLLEEIPLGKKLTTEVLSKGIETGFEKATV